MTTFRHFPYRTWEVVFLPLARRLGSDRLTSDRLFRWEPGPFFSRSRSWSREMKSER